MANSDLLSSAMSAGGRCSRFGDFVVVKMTSMSFATSAQDYQMASRWARSKQSSGNVNRDRTTFVERFDTILGRSGSGIASKGSKPVLQRIVSGLKQNGGMMSDWQIPHNLYESVEVKKKPQPKAKPDA